MIISPAIAITLILTTTGSKSSGIADPIMPLGEWRVEFTNNVVEDCLIMSVEGRTIMAVYEPLRSSRADVTRSGEALLMSFVDDRVERWTQAGSRYIVEHWAEAKQFPNDKPVLGVAVREGLSSADRSRLEESSTATVKIFVADMRTRFTPATAGNLRSLIDPRYLNRYGVGSGDFAMQTVVTGNIYDLQLLGDGETVMAVAGTEHADKELFIFRMSVHNGRTYIKPMAPPNKTTRSFEPWILRMKL